MEDKIKAALEAIRPSLQNDGGDIEYISTVDKTVNVRLKGHCATCAYSQLTLKNGIENYLKNTVDENLVVVNHA